MREIDFLPAWYPKVRRQRRLLTIQAYATAVLVLAGLIALFATQRKADAARHELEGSKQRAQKTIEAVHELDEMLKLEQRLSQQQRIVAELGLPVEVNRVLAEVGSCLPREATLTQINVLTQETSQQLTILDRATGKNGGPRRQMELKVSGVAPTEAEVTTFWTRLAALPFLEQVKLINTDESRQGDHLMRKFEVTFVIRLDFQSGLSGTNGGTR